MKIPDTCLLVALFAGSPIAHSQDDAPETKPPVADEGFEVVRTLQRSFARIAEQVSPSIVTIAAYERGRADVEPEASEGPRAMWLRQLDASYPGFRRIGAGSGIVMSSDGHILTNRHFLLKEDGEVADLIDIETADNRHTISRVVGLEPTLNMAVLKLEVFSPGNPPRFQPITFGDSTELFPGHWALAIGDPFGPEKFFSFGLFAGTPSRECYQEQLSATYLQAALQVHPGAYGGALLNLRGELVGMLTPRSLELGSIAGSYGVELAVPSNIVRAIYPTIVKNESFRSPWLGFAVMSRTELRRELGTQEFMKLKRPMTGIYLENVFAPSPVEGAGVKAGDFLTRFNGAYIGSPIDFQKQLYMAGVGSEVNLEFFRDGETFEARVKVEERPPEAITR